MQKQKKGFWLFIFSLIPGAGEMYMGFKKQGISIMLLFYSLFAIGAGTGMSWIIMFFPIIWFYSFFNVHNLKSLSEEEFYAVEDSYILHLDEFLGSTNAVLTKYRLIVAVLMITFGASILWNALSDIMYWILPNSLANLLQSAGYMLPQLVIAVCIILGGIYLLKHKKEETPAAKGDLEDEHFWQPYRPEASAADAFRNMKPTSPAKAEGEVKPVDNVETIVETDNKISSDIETEIIIENKAEK